MNAEILAVGTELLLGQIANTNAQYLSKELSSVGINVFYHSAVGDNKERLLECLKIASSRSDLVILTGGLGPTLDDLTKETLAEFLNLPLIPDDESIKTIESYMQKRGRKVTLGNLKQASFPTGAIILSNEHGTAPGAIIRNNNVEYILLPGPPFELKPMFEKHCLPRFAKLGDLKIVSKRLRIYGIGESLVEEKIKDLIVNQTNPTIAPLAGYGDVTLRLTVKCSRFEDPEHFFSPIEKEIRNRLGDFIYGIEDESLEFAVLNLLKKNKQSVSIAESCTGGLITDMLTNIAGASDHFLESSITYSNLSKVKNLNVQPETIEKYGAVSGETVSEMANGIRIKSGSDYGLACSGIAGPDGGTPDKPVGLFFVAVSLKDGTILVQKHFLIGDRRRIKITGANIALNFLRLTIIEKNN